MFKFNKEKSLKEPEETHHSTHKTGYNCWAFERKVQWNKTGYKYIVIPQQFIKIDTPKKGLFDILTKRPKN